MMSSLPARIVALLESRPGLTDREITDELLGPSAAHQHVNSLCRRLAVKGALFRSPRSDGKIGNTLAPSRPYTLADDTLPGSVLPVVANSASSLPAAQAAQSDMLSEDAIKAVLEKWLQDEGWTVKVAWARVHGIDIEAERGDERWVIEVKGRGSLQAMRVNFFLMILGELLQRMDDAEAKYSLAVPDLPQYRGLWGRLPALAKERTGITALFVDEQGRVSEA